MHHAIHNVAHHAKKKAHDMKVHYYLLVLIINSAFTKRIQFSLPKESIGTVVISGILAIPLFFAIMIADIIYPIYKFFTIIMEGLITFSKVEIFKVKAYHILTCGILLSSIIVLFSF